MNKTIDIFLSACYDAKLGWNGLIFWKKTVLLRGGG